MIKEKIKQDSLFLNLYLIYTLVFKYKFYKKRKTYSQWGEDVFIKNFFLNKSVGKYLDIGCYHPIKYSNTAVLYDIGWSGINVDINPVSIKLFNLVRKKDKNYCLTFDDRKLKFRVYIDHLFSPINSIKKNFLYGEKDRKHNYKSKTTLVVRTSRFEDLVKKNFDFLNIDVEGLETNILMQINFKKFRPKLIAVEIHGDIKLKKNQQIAKLLKKNKYRHVKKFGPTCLFVKH